MHFILRIVDKRNCVTETKANKKMDNYRLYWVIEYEVRNIAL